MNYYYIAKLAICNRYLNNFGGEIQQAQLSFTMLLKDTILGSYVKFLSILISVCETFSG